MMAALFLKRPKENLADAKCYLANATELKAACEKGLLH